MPGRLWSLSSSQPNERLTAVSGYLWKMKRERRVLVPQWNRRFFTIEGSTINWYSDEHSKTPRHKLPLVNITSISPFETSGGVYSFIVSSTSRNLFLRADTLQTMEMWVRAIQMHADLARGGDGTHLISAASPNVAAKRSKKHGRSLEEALEKSIRDLEALEKQANCNSGSAANTASIVHPSPGPATSQDAITSTHTGDSLDSCGDLHVYTFDGRRSVSNADASSPPRLSHQDGVYSPPPVYNMENIVERFDYDLPSPPNKSQSARMAGRPGKAIPVKCKSEAWA